MTEERVVQGDTLVEMDKLIAEGIVVDAIICDPPFGTTACKWDTVIPFEPMWERLNKLIKPNGAIVLFGSEPFSSALRMSNIKNYKYDWVWNKKKAGNIFIAKKQPLKIHEIISVFNNHYYYPQKTTIIGKIRDQRKEKPTLNRNDGAVTPKGFIRYADDYDPSKRFPVSIIYFPNHREKEEVFHPTQKPVALMEYLIKTYTNEGELVLDFTAGSGSTLLACKNLNRNFIGIEKEEKYIEIIKTRLSPTSNN